MKKEREYVIKSSEVELVPVKPEAEDYTIWDVKWDIRDRKNDNSRIGDIHFKGVPERGTLQIEFSIDPEAKNHGYAKDAVKMMVEWAFARKGIYEIEATCQSDNDAAIHVLERAGFVYRTKDNNLETYSIIKEKPSWLGLYAIIGFIAGLGIGLVLESMVIGMIIGLFAGFSIGTYLDTSSNKERSKVTGKAVTYRRVKLFKK